MFVCLLEGHEICDLTDIEKSHFPSKYLWHTVLRCIDCGSYPLPHLGLGLSDRNIGKNVMKSLPCGLCLPSRVSGRQRVQDGSVTEDEYKKVNYRIKNSLS